MSVLSHIGYHKTGTNWLQRRFFSDPETGYRWLGKRPASHPVRSFVRDRPFEFDPPAVRAALDPLLAEAEEAGLLPVISLERLSGSALSGGYDSREIAERLHLVFPDARILVAVREQRSMLVSTYKGYVQQGGAASLASFLDPPRSRSVRVPLFDARFLEYDRLVSYTGPSALTVLGLAFDQRGGRRGYRRSPVRRPPDSRGGAQRVYGHRENVRRPPCSRSPSSAARTGSGRDVVLAPSPSRAAGRLADRLVRTTRSASLCRRRRALRREVDE
jgi:hypothetical protein